MEIYRKLLQLLDRRQRIALLSVVSATGSTPQRVGAKAIVDQQGRLLAGTIGGGLMESKAIGEGRQAIVNDAATIFECAMDEVYHRDAGPICGGVMRVFAAPCRPGDRNVYEQAMKVAETRERGLVVTTIAGEDAGRTRWLAEEAVENGGNAGATFASILRRERPGTILESGSELFVEPVAAPPRMLVVGGGHVGQVVVQHAIWLGFDVTVLDDRAEFAQADRFAAGAKVVCGAIREQVGRFPKESDSYLVLVSKGHKSDAEALEQCIHCQPAYIGMIGSRRKIALLRQHFLESGLATEQELARIFAPIGLDIAAVTVEEIAASIMAQVVSVRRQGLKGTRTKQMEMR